MEMARKGSADVVIVIELSSKLSKEDEGLIKLI